MKSLEQHQVGRSKPDSTHRVAATLRQKLLPRRRHVPIKRPRDVCYEDACAAGSLLAAAHTATIKEYDALSTSNR